MKQLSAVLIVCSGLGLYAQGAHAGVCTDQIAALETALNRSATHHKGGLTAPQSLSAQLHHQPTPASVSQAKEQAQGRVDTLIEQARHLDSKGEDAACLEKVGEAKSVVDLQ